VKSIDHVPSALGKRLLWMTFVVWIAGAFVFFIRATGQDLTAHRPSLETSQLLQSDEATTGCGCSETGLISCEGNACGDVVHRFDNGTHYFKNNSKKKVKVELEAVGGGTNALPLGPGEEKAAFLKAFRDPYKANYE